jgi:preprotein translocase subunit SecA
MFGQMMSSIDDDYVKYVMHTQVQVEERAPEPSLAGAQYFAPDAPVLGTRAIADAMAAGPAPGEEVVFASEEDVAARGNGRSRGNGTGGLATVARTATAEPSEFDRVGRNDACPCGSGKKFKFCHGR